MDDDSRDDIPVAKMLCSVCAKPLPDADPTDIKKRYRELVKKHHPDLGGDAAKFRLLKSVYDEILQRLDESVDAWGRCPDCAARAEPPEPRLVGVAPRSR